MKCSGCQTGNPEQAKFCIECGAKLEFHCPNCGAVTPANGKFCMECGNNLKEAEPQSPVNYRQPQSYTPKHLADKILSHRSAIEGERKLVTVLFADVAGFTAVSEKLDPEEVHQVMDGCFKILMDEIHRCEGTINQFTGDGVMSLFGAPVAHEDHAQRACRAALAVQKALAGYGEKVKGQYGVPFQMRIGLNSGPVIVGAIGDDLRMDYTAVGDTTNLAARVEQHTEPGMVYLSRETRNIIRDYFESVPVGEMAFKGKSEPQAIYRLVSEYPHVRNRFEAGLVRGVTELVGRKREIDELKAAFEKAASGETQIVDVVGEAGIGKSRLVYEFRESLGKEALFLTALCMQYGGSINFLPVMDIVKAVFAIEQDMSEVDAGRRIEDKAVGRLASMIPFYRSLLSLKVDDPKFAALQPEGRKYGTFEAVKDLLIRLSEEKPVVVFVEDVHWIDKISEEFFTFFSRCIAEHPILLLSAYRPEGAPPWAQGMQYQRLGLETLSSQSSVHLVQNILGGSALEPALENRIIEKTKGNPFFMEEIVRELLERGEIVKSDDRYVSSRPTDQLHIPNTVQAVLAARMDRLSDDLKRTMQVASVIGRDFAFKILKNILELGDQLRGHLTNLVGLEILYEKTLFPELEYIFKHALTQEVAYESLLKQRRQAIHGRIAQAVEELYPDRLDEHYELLAHHYERSGNVEKAVHYLLLAGEKSNQRHAVHSASEFFRKAIALSDSSAFQLTPEMEMRLYYGLALAVVSIGGSADEDFVKQTKKAIKHSQDLGMIEYERKCYFILAHNTISWHSQSESKQILSDGLARARSTGDKILESQMMSFRALNACAFSSIKKGYEIALDAGKIALEAKDPFSILFARIQRSYPERWLGRPEKSADLSKDFVETTRKLGNLASASLIMGTRGINLAEIGQIEKGIELLQRGIEFDEKFGVFFKYALKINGLGYCYAELFDSKMALGFNSRAEKIARELFDKFPNGRLNHAEMIAQSRINVFENLFDQGKIDEAWNQLQTFEKESRSGDYDFLRYIWESRMYVLAARILVCRNELEQAESVVRENLLIVMEQGSGKRQGSFLRLLGEVQMRRNEFDSAIENLHKAINILMGVGNARKLWEAHQTLALAFDKMGRGSEAQDQWGHAVAVIKKFVNGLSDKGFQDGFLSAGPVREILAKAG
jgi:class 3 adenylate cyclase/tetratricopeptide (TPR) repeat protein